MPNHDSSELLPPGVRVTNNCPPLSLLRAWQSDALPEELVHDVATHVGTCRICSGLLADLDQLPEPTITMAERERIRRKLPLLVPVERKSPSWRWYSTAAAVALVAFASVFMAVHETRKSTEVAQSAPEAAPASPTPVSPAVASSSAVPQIQVARLDPPIALAPGMVLRGEASSTEPTAQQLEPAFRAYNAGDYPKAIDTFSQLAKRYPRSGTPFLYLGVSQLLTNDDSNALFNLTRAEKFVSTAQRDDAIWYRLAASVRTHAPDAAQQAHDLCNAQHSRYSSQACELEKSLTAK